MEPTMQQIQLEIKTIVKGKDEIITKILAAMLAGGHILLEDVPGVGKTTMALSIARAIDLQYKRVQFTPDVLPSDILGFSLYRPDTKQFVYQEGAVCCNLFLADEINRTSPKTQSALLEVMEEGSVTVDGVTRPLPKPFTVIATENPIGSAGTQLLPESQLDRFMVCLSMGYPSHEAAIDILKGNAEKHTDLIRPVLDTDAWMAYQKKANDIYVHDAIFDYIVTLTEATRSTPLFVSGISPRGSIALLHMSKSIALLAGRDFVTPEDIHAVLFDVFAHRLTLSSAAHVQNLDKKQALKSLCDAIPVPRT